MASSVAPRCGEIAPSDSPLHSFEALQKFELNLLQEEEDGLFSVKIDFGLRLTNRLYAGL